MSALSPYQRTDIDYAAYQNTEQKMNTQRQLGSIAFSHQQNMFE